MELFISIGIPKSMEVSLLVGFPISRTTSIFMATSMNMAIPMANFPFWSSIKIELRKSILHEHTALQLSRIRLSTQLPTLNWHGVLNWEGILNWDGIHNWDVILNQDNSLQPGCQSPTRMSYSARMGTPDSVLNSDGVINWSDILNLSTIYG